MLRLKWLKDIHWPLVFSMLSLAAIGVIFIHSASYYDQESFASRQIFWVMLGFIACFTVAFIGYRTFLGMSYLLYVISLVLLVWVSFMGHVRLGAQRWIHLGPLAIQPSEFAKLATVLALANFLGSYSSWEKQKRIVTAVLIMTLVPLVFILKQPDLGTAMLFIPMMIVLLFLWGIRYRYLIGGLIAGLATIPFLWEFLKTYQKKRILVFLNPNLDPLGMGYTATQSKIAVGSGGLLGKGYLAGTQSQLQFVPEHHTDFIFCVLGEEWGFAGSVLLLILFGLLFKAGFQVMQQTTDQKAKLLAGGILSLIFAQVMVNIGMTFGMLPIAGITLPLISYGGSSFVSTSIALGLILSIYKERSIF